MESTSSNATSARFWELSALAISFLAVGGSLYLSMGMNLKACPLCLYERAFMMGAAGVLLIGFFRSRDMESNLPPLLCMPVAVAGLCVAAFHVYLELTNFLECPAGLMGIGTAPQQSLAAFVFVTALSAMAIARSTKSSSGVGSVFGAVVLGAFFSFTAIKSVRHCPNLRPNRTPHRWMDVGRPTTQTHRKHVR